MQHALRAPGDRLTPRPSALPPGRAPLTGSTRLGTRAVCRGKESLGTSTRRRESAPPTRTHPGRERRVVQRGSARARAPRRSRVGAGRGGRMRIEPSALPSSAAIRAGSLATPLGRVRRTRAITVGERAGPVVRACAQTASTVRSERRIAARTGRTARMLPPRIGVARARKAAERSVLPEARRDVGCRRINAMRCGIRRAGRNPLGRGEVVTEAAPVARMAGPHRRRGSVRRRDDLPVARRWAGRGIATAARMRRRMRGRGATVPPGRSLSATAVKRAGRSVGTAWREEPLTVVLSTPCMTVSRRRP